MMAVFLFYAIVPMAVLSAGLTVAIQSLRVGRFVFGKALLAPFVLVPLGLLLGYTVFDGWIEARSEALRAASERIWEGPGFPGARVGPLALVLLPFFLLVLAIEGAQTGVWGALLGWLLAHAVACAVGLTLAVLASVVVGARAARRRFRVRAKAREAAS